MWCAERGGSTHSLTLCFTNSRTGLGPEVVLCCVHSSIGGVLLLLFFCISIQSMHHISAVGQQQQRTGRCVFVCTKKAACSWCWWYHNMRCPEIRSEFEADHTTTTEHPLPLAVPTLLYIIIPVGIYYYYTRSTAVHVIYIYFIQG